MEIDMKTTAKKILSYAAKQPEGAVLSAKGLLHLGGRAAVDQALSRLVKRGQLLRLGRGVYTAPVKTRFGLRAPQPEKVVKAISESFGETITPSGASSANALNLTTQVPVKTVYLTSGRSRRMRLGKHVVELRHAPLWQLRAPASRAGAALRALLWLGPSLARKKIDVLGSRLKKRDRAELLALRSHAPTWLVSELSQAFQP